MTQSDYSRRFDAAVAEMDAAGLSRSGGLPHYLKLACKLGLEPPPPMYLSFVKVVILVGSQFGLGLAILKSFVTGWEPARPLHWHLISLTVTALLFGLGAAIWHRHFRKKHRLSAWQDF